MKAGGDESGEVGKDTRGYACRQVGRVETVDADYYGGLCGERIGAVVQGYVRPGFWVAVRRGVLIEREMRSVLNSDSVAIAS